MLPPASSLLKLGFVKPPPGVIPTVPIVLIVVFACAPVTDEDPLSELVVVAPLVVVNLSGVADLAPWCFPYDPGLVSLYSGIESELEVVHLLGEVFQFPECRFDFSVYQELH